MSNLIAWIFGIVLIAWQAPGKAWVWCFARGR